ncbi:MAG: hypothetical protein ACREJB_02020 [Planctomycetaceae bacterium]
MPHLQYPTAKPFSLPKRSVTDGQTLTIEGQVHLNGIADDVPDGAGRVVSVYVVGQRPGEEVRYISNGGTMAIKDGDKYVFSVELTIHKGTRPVDCKLQIVFFYENDQQTILESPLTIR